MQDKEPPSGQHATDRTGASAPPHATPKQGEHFIPLSQSNLVRLLADDADLTPDDLELFAHFCTLLAATFHHEFHRQHRALKECYAPLNPDSVLHSPVPLSAEQRAECAPRVFTEFAQLLEQANYRRLARAEIEQAVGAASDWGMRLHVDFNAFEYLAVFIRGDIVVRRQRRHWLYFRRETIDVPLYQRLVVIFQLHSHQWLSDVDDTESVYIKLFKNIPKQDVDMLLPASRFRMTLLDRGKIILPTLSGLAIAVFKIVQTALLLPWFGILVLVAGTLGYGMKSVFGYLHTRDKYQLCLTRNLYYQNLDNNAGVLFRVLEEAEEQELREAILGYALLRRGAPDAGWTAEELDRRCEAYLSEKAGVVVDFEVRDSLRKLDRLGCIEKTSAGRWRAVPLARVLPHLDAAWDALFGQHAAKEPASQVEAGDRDTTETTE